MIIDAKKKFGVNITSRHAEKACSQDGTCDTNYCVVAEALKEGLKKAGTPALAVQVGPQRTVLVFKGREVRYSTPSVLRSALTEWDKTRKWPLGDGEYFLQPIPKSATRKYKKEQAKRRRAEGDPAMIKTSSTTKKNKPATFSARAITFSREVRAAAAQ